MAGVVVLVKRQMNDVKVWLKMGRKQSCRFGSFPKIGANQRALNIDIDRAAPQQDPR